MKFFFYSSEPFFFQNLNLVNVNTNNLLLSTENYIDFFCYKNASKLFYKNLYFIKKKINILSKPQIFTYVDYLNIFSSVALKDGKKLLATRTISLIFFYFFFFLKKNIINSFNFNSGSFNFFFFIKNFFNNNTNIMNINSVLWWLTSFFDLNFWVICTKLTKKKISKSNVNDSKYMTQIKIFSNIYKKHKNFFKILHLNAKYDSKLNFKNRTLFVVFDSIFNYKNSSLYKKKLLVYKKIFK